MKLHGKDNLIFIGMMGAGKTTVARECATILGMQFCDSDQIFHERFGDISAVFCSKGEAFFRSEEEKILLTLSKKQNTAIACGGGAVMWKDFDILKTSGITVYLKARIETLFERLKTDNTRPLNLGQGSLTDILQQRERLYNQYADFTIVTDNQTPQQLSKTIVEMILR